LISFRFKHFLTQAQGIITFPTSEYPDIPTQHLLCGGFRWHPTPIILFPDAMLPSSHLCSNFWLEPVFGVGVKSNLMQIIRLFTYLHWE